MADRNIYYWLWWRRLKVPTSRSIKLQAASFSQKKTTQYQWHKCHVTLLSLKQPFQSLIAMICPSCSFFSVCYDQIALQKREKKLQKWHNIWNTQSNNSELHCEVAELNRVKEQIKKSAITIYWTGHSRSFDLTVALSNHVYWQFRLPNWEFINCSCMSVYSSSICQIPPGKIVSTLQNLVSCLRGHHSEALCWLLGKLAS